MIKSYRGGGCSVGFDGGSGDVGGGGSVGDWQDTETSFSVKHDCLEALFLQSLEIKKQVTIFLK